MTKIFSQFTSYFMHPIPTIRRLLLAGPKGLGSMIIIVFILLMIVSNVISAPDAWENKPVTQLEIVGLQIITLALGILLFVSIVHLSADFLGGAGRGISLLYLEFSAFLPFWFFKLSSMIIENVFELFIVHQIISLCMIFWFILLTTFNIKELYRFSWLKTLLALIIPIAVTSICFGILLLSLHTSFAHQTIDSIIRGFLNF